MRIGIAAALVLLCTSTVAFAQDDQQESSGFAGLRGSLAFGGSLREKASTTPAIDLKSSFGTGAGISAFWGMNLGDGFKAEFEALYRYMPLSSITLNGLKGKAGGDGNMFAPMVNAYWYAPTKDWGFQPFIGGGIGYAWDELSVSNIAGTPTSGLDENSWGLTYNGMVGVSVPAGRGSHWSLMYRYLHNDVDPGCGTGVKCSGNFSTSSIDVGYAMDL